MLTKQEILLGRGAWAESGGVREPRVLPGGDTSLSQDGCQRGGFWEVVGHVVSPFDLSRTLPFGGGLLVPCSLPGPPVIKQVMHMVTMVPGQGEQFQSVYFP